MVEAVIYRLKFRIEFLEERNEYLKKEAESSEDKFERGLCRGQILGNELTIIELESIIRALERRIDGEHTTIRREQSGAEERKAG